MEANQERIVNNMVLFKKRSVASQRGRQKIFRLGIYFDSIVTLDKVHVFERDLFLLASNQRSSPKPMVVNLQK